MTKTQILDAIGELQPDGKRFMFSTRTCPALTKKNRTTKAPTNFTVEVCSTFTAKVGANYQKEVNDLLEAAGQPRNFIAQKPSGKHHVENTNWLLEADATPGKFYIALSGFADRRSAYFINGVMATPDQIEDLKVNYLPKASPKPNDGKPVVEWRTYSIENIYNVVKCED